MRAQVVFVGEPPPGVGLAPLRRLVRNALLELGRDGSVGVRFAGDATLRQYNQRYRGVDRPTDVLSFPSAETPPANGYLGDLLISRERARIQSRASGLTLRREVEELLLHGLLHLLGHDHERDSGEMDALELALRERLLERPRRAPGGR